jgi:hypothetical protein
MTENHNKHDHDPVPGLNASLHLHPPRGHGGEHSRARLHRRLMALLRHRVVRRTAYVSAISIFAAALLVGGMWWRLSSGPIELNIVTPWIASAIEENFGRSHKVEIGGTQIERDENGRTALRIRDIVVRDPDGVVVAAAPKAEVSLSGTSLLSGRVRASSLNLVGAELKVRIESDGSFTVFAGAETRPIATAPVPPVLPPKISTTPSSVTPSDPAGSATGRSGYEDIAALLSWIDGLGASGLDGYELSELGLIGGNLIVDDQRNGKRLTFSRINLSLTRPTRGGVELRLGSDNPERQWAISAGVIPTRNGTRAVALEARKVSSKDLLLALRLGEGAFEADMLLSASLRGEIALDGTPQFAQGQVLAESGYITDFDDPPARVDIDRAEFDLNWDAQRRAFSMPFRVTASDNQFAMVAQIRAVPDQPGVWLLEVNRSPMVDPIILGAVNTGGPEPLSLNRAVIRARIDLERKRVDLEQGDIGRSDVRANYNIGLAVSGFLDYSGTEPRLALGVAGTKMPVNAALRLWPVFVATNVREFAEHRISGGTVDRILIALNTPTPTLKATGPPIPDEAMQIEFDTSGTSIKPLDTLPAVRDADVNIRITGRTATFTLGRGTVETPSGRKLNVANGVFEIPDIHPKEPPARARFRVDGQLPAAAELLAMEPLRDAAGVPIDPATTRGAITAQVQIMLPLAKEIRKSALTYSVAADITNMSADHMIAGQKVESPALKVTLNQLGLQVRGDVKVNGTPAAFEYRKLPDQPDSEIRLAATLDEATRARIGFDFGPSVTGGIPIRMVGRVSSPDQDVRYAVEADLTAVKIDNVFPGWSKASGKSAKATFNILHDRSGIHIDDLAIDGQGATVRGSLDLDNDGDVVTANFPVFALSDGDKISLKADRGNDGILRAVVRGDVYDGRGFVKSSMSGVADARQKKKSTDLDLDVKIGVVAGHNGEALRGLDLKLSRRSGRVRNFSLAAKLGRDTPFVGDIRTRVANNKPVVYLETNDAGALFRFIDVYPRMNGGRVIVGFDPPTADGSPQDGIINVSNFQIRGEPALERVVASAPGAPGQRGVVDFSQARAEFVKSPGRMQVKNGVVRGPVVGATIEGNVDYARDEINMRGTFVPLYGLNNMFGQIPIIGFILGGPNSNEGVFGVTYEITGQPSNFRIVPNPLSAIAPGLLRKFFEFRDNSQPAFADPTR